MHYIHILCVVISDVDEQDHLEPEHLRQEGHDQKYIRKMRGARVMRTNYSLLWQQLEPSRLLPILVNRQLMTETGKNEVESYGQKFAQNSVIIDQLFRADCPPLELCDPLDVTGQWDLSKKLRQGMYCVECIYHICFIEVFWV